MCDGDFWRKAQGEVYCSELLDCFIDEECCYEPWLFLRLLYIS